MHKALPPRPHFDWLKKAAKKRLAALRARDPAAKLNQAQRALARDYGFASWRALKAKVDTLSLDGQIVAATIDGQAADLDRLLKANPTKLLLTGGPWKTPLLHLAAANGHLACVEVLLKRGFDVNRRDRLDNATALHWAAGGGRLDIVKRLLEAGAEIDGAGDAHAVGVIGWATCLRSVHRTVAELLLVRGAKPTLFAAVALGSGDLVREIVARDRSALARTMTQFEHRRTALHLAVIKNQAAMVDLLLSLGADPAAKDDDGKTPLALAAAKTDPAIVARLLSAGADPKEHAVIRFESAVPILNVKSVPAAIDYYVNKLGFEKKWDWGDPPVFGCVGRDKVSLFLCQDSQGAPGMWISIFVNDVDALYDDYKKRGAIIRQKPTNFPWGVREMNVQDLDGHRLRLGSEATGPSDGVPLPEEA